MVNWQERRANDPRSSSISDDRLILKISFCAKKASKEFPQTKDAS